MKTFLPLIFIFLTYYNTGAQLFVGTAPKQMPSKYLNSIESYQNTLVIEKVTCATNWEIWVDREGVTTSNGRKPAFMEQFFVVDETDAKVHIVKSDKGLDLISNFFLEEPADFGWIEKKYALLWNTALCSEKTNFRIKILTITDPAIMNQQMEDIKKNAKLLTFYNSPYGNNPNENVITLFQVFYIYKSEGSRVLIGKREKIETGNAGLYINGWVDKKNIQVWGQRQTLEPNIDPTALKNRQAANVKTAVFSDKAEVSEYESDGNSQKAFWTYDEYETAINPYWKRLPIMSVDNDVYETAVVSNIIKESGEKYDVRKYNTLQQKYNEQRDRSRKMNIIFLVDGTESMAPYVESVKKAVIQVAQKVRTSDNDYQFSAVIYRDYKSKDDDDCYEVLPLSNYDKFYRFMSQVETDNPACYDRTFSEGMYKGFIKTQSQLSGKEKQTNIIILVGDAGDRDEPGRYTQDDAISILKKYAVSLITIQVHNYTHQAYQDFIWQARDLGLISASSLADIQRAEYLKLNLPSLMTKPRWQQKTVENRTLFTMQYSPVSGGLQYAKKGESISPEKVGDEIQKMIIDLDAQNDKMLNDLEVIMNSMVSDTSNIGGFSAQAIQMLQKAGFSTEDIELLIQRKYQFLLHGYTAIKTDKTANIPLYNFVLFIDQGELDGIISSLDKLYTPKASGSERREKMRNSWYEVLKTNYGVKEEDVKNKSLAELTGLITGLPSKSYLLQKYKVDDLTDRTVVNDADFDQIYELFKVNREKLNIADNNKKYKFLSNDRAYYWIPQSMLP